MADRFDILTAEGLGDPYRLFAELRAESPLHYVPSLDHFVVTRFADIETILLDRDRFSAAGASSPIIPLGERAQRILDAGQFRRVATLNNADPPRHAPMRKAVLSCLSPRRIRGFEPWVREAGSRFVADLARHPFVDFVSSLSFPFPAHVAFTLLGFPDDDVEILKDWSRRRVLLTYGRLGDEEQAQAAEAVVAFWQYVERFVRHRFSEPGEDLVSALLEVHRAAPGTVTVDDVSNITYSLALAGHETTTNLLTNGVRQLLLHREQWRALCQDPALIPNAVEEMLRFDGPVLIHRRQCTVDTDIGGVSIPAGARVMLLFASGHRDGEQFDDPDTFDIGRANAELHLSFGRGAHFCLGAPLARMEAGIILEELTQRLPDLHLAADQDIEFVPNLHFRSISRLMVTPHGTTATTAG